jgi:hypothetical protein
LTCSVYCISDILNPTPVYVVQGDDAVLQCGFESISVLWEVHSGGWVNIALVGDSLDGSKN